MRGNSVPPQQDKQPRKINTNGKFAVTPLIAHIIVIAIVIFGYNYIFTHGLFPEWINYIYYTMKVIVALEIFAASAQTLWAPILTLIGGAAVLYLENTYNLAIATSADGWQLMLAALIGFLITIVTKF